jgi:hypothetical protein
MGISEEAPIIVEAKRVLTGEPADHQGFTEHAQ